MSAQEGERCVMKISMVLSKRKNTDRLVSFPLVKCFPYKGLFFILILSPPAFFGINCLSFIKLDKRYKCTGVSVPKGFNASKTKVIETVSVPI